MHFSSFEDEKEHLWHLYWVKCDSVSWKTEVALALHVYLWWNRILNGGPLLQSLWYELSALAFALMCGRKRIAMWQCTAIFFFLFLYVECFVEDLMCYSRKTMPLLFPVCVLRARCSYQPLFNCLCNVARFFNFWYVSLWGLFCILVPQVCDGPCFCYFHGPGKERIVLV